MGGRSIPELGHGDPSLHGAAIRRILLPAQSYVRHRITKYPLKEQVAIAYDKLMKTKHYVARDKALAARYPFVAMPSRDDEGWLIVFPDIPGVVGFATTWDAIGVEAQNILAGWFEGEAEDGHPLPAPTPEWNPVERQPGDYSLPTLYSTEDVANILGVQKRQVQKLAASRSVGSKIANGLVFTPEDIEQMHDRRLGRPRKTA